MTSMRGNNLWFNIQMHKSQLTHPEKRDIVLDFCHDFCFPPFFDLSLVFRRWICFWCSFSISLSLMFSLNVYKANKTQSELPVHSHVWNGRTIKLLQYEFDVKWIKSFHFIGNISQNSKKQITLYARWVNNF